jgi:hypothetical protein
LPIPDILWNHRVFTLIPGGGKTRLRVVESGFSLLAGSEDLRRKALEEDSGGWPQVMDAGLPPFTRPRGGWPRSPPTGTGAW